MRLEARKAFAARTTRTNGHQAQFLDWLDCGSKTDNDHRDTAVIEVEKQPQRISPTRTGNPNVAAASVVVVLWCAFQALLTWGGVILLVERWWSGS